ncbi:unnamed protein product [Polarella glacialis]|uniref:Uncharacterized protein n=1 Tax=Polarella glacialis TaxID=89957 RepID=A0A813FCA1_POLGL|nr:unnamed protein product [Polarella glacialis]
MRGMCIGGESPLQQQHQRQEQQQQQHQQQHQQKQHQQHQQQQHSVDARGGIWQLSADHPGVMKSQQEQQQQQQEQQQQQQQKYPLATAIPKSAAVQETAAWHGRLGFGSGAVGGYNHSTGTGCADPVVQKLFLEAGLSSHVDVIAALLGVDVADDLFILDPGIVDTLPLNPVHRARLRCVLLSMHSKCLPAQDLGTFRDSVSIRCRYGAACRFLAAGCCRYQHDSSDNNNFNTATNNNNNNNDNNNNDNNNNDNNDNNNNNSNKLLTHEAVGYSAALQPEREASPSPCFDNGVESEALNAGSLLHSGAAWQQVLSAPILESRPTIFLQPGEVGRGYRTLYGQFLQECVAVVVQAPYLASPRGSTRLAQFLQLLHDFPLVANVVLETDGESNDRPPLVLQKIRAAERNHGLQIHIRIQAGLHHRCLFFVHKSFTWKVVVDRGLDHLRYGPLDIEPEMSRCLRTKVEANRVDICASWLTSALSDYSHPTGCFR